jgi:hypothetical protein
MKLTLLGVMVLLSPSIVFGAPRFPLTSKSSFTLPVAVVDLNQDNIWAVIEFPQGKEVTVDLVGTPSAPNAKGTARVTRGSNGSEIGIELSGLPSEIESYQLYAIDSLGNATTLGSLTVSDGASSLKTQTALTTFMLLVSPKDDVVTLTAETQIALHSKAPEGYKIVSRTSAPEVGSGVASSSNEPETPLVADYDVPLLNIATIKSGVATQMKSRLFDDLQGSRINVSVTPKKKGLTQVDFVFRDLEPPAEGRHYVIWAVGPDKAYSVLGSVAAGKQSKVNSVAEFSDFGLFITIEDTDSPILPAGKMVAMIVR